MKRILLAIDGLLPNRKAFHYAVDLCSRMRAELNVFQILRPQLYRECIRKIKKKSVHARNLLEGAMVAATFAEAGEQEFASEIAAEASTEIKSLLHESQEAGVHCHFLTATGDPEKEIVNYVDNHWNVVLTIYDHSTLNEKSASVRPLEKGMLTRMKKNMSVPLVTVHH
jgi:nucleotide-binding universal stress UspA family protein